jgi:DNA-binding response OmpR family regulator
MKPMSERILIVEDERPMRTVLTDCLTAEGYRVLTAVQGEQALEKAQKEMPDLILLDVMMPRVDGFQVCRELRRLHFKNPILMLTAKGQIDDRVKGLDCGADDYLVKPFSTRELLARVRAVLRRERRKGASSTSIQLGNVTIDFVRQEAFSGTERLHVTPKEFAMLRLMNETPNEPVSREQFLDIVWGYATFPTTRTVDNHIVNLRQKIEPDPNKPRWIRTVHGVGYKLAGPDSDGA